MSTLDAAKPSCSNAKGSNERPLNDDDCSTRAKPPKLKPQPSQSLPSPKPQPVAKHLTTDNVGQPQMSRSALRLLISFRASSWARYARSASERPSPTVI